MLDSKLNLFWINFYVLIKDQRINTSKKIKSSELHDSKHWIEYDLYSSLIKHYNQQISSSNQNEIIENKQKENIISYDEFKLKFQNQHLKQKNFFLNKIKKLEWKQPVKFEGYFRKIYSPDKIVEKTHNFSKLEESLKKLFIEQERSIDYHKMSSSEQIIYDFIEMRGGIKYKYRKSKSLQFKFKISESEAILFVLNEFFRSTFEQNFELLDLNPRSKMWLNSKTYNNEQIIQTFTDIFDISEKELLENQEKYIFSEKKLMKTEGAVEYLDFALKNQSFCHLLSEFIDFPNPSSRSIFDKRKRTKIETKIILMVGNYQFAMDFGGKFLTRKQNSQNDPS